MLKRFIPVVFISVFVCFFVGCMSYPGGVTQSTIPIISDDTYTIVKEDADGTSWSLGFFGIPFWYPSVYRALQAAKEDNNADALINVSCNTEVLLFPISYHTCYIKGDAVKVKRKGRK